MSDYQIPVVPWAIFHSQKTSSSFGFNEAIAGHGNIKARWIIQLWASRLFGKFFQQFV